MIVALAFIGKLPSYIIECIHQIRSYFEGSIYLIIDDTESIYLQSICIYNITIIRYSNVSDKLFLDTVSKNINKFYYVCNLHGREQLFVRSFERFFVLKNLLEKINETDCLFLELDNLIYDDPNKWIKSFSKYDLCYMYDNEDRFSSGLMYVKNHNALDGFLSYIINYINTSNEFLNEMSTLCRYYKLNTDKICILPTYWLDKSVPSITNLHYLEYNDSIFDALAIGCYLLGIDPYHTNGVIKTNTHAHWCAVNYTQLKFDWKIDEKERKRPYVWNGEKWLLINNLHVHSKDLKSGLSKFV